jgi:omega-6 fatty acid desaturase (delta-12 desaturase)
MPSSPPESAPNNWNRRANLENEKLLDRELLISSREFANEQRIRSWWHLVTTLLAIFGSATVAAMADAIWMRAFASLLTGLTAVRMFIIYHDYQHGAIFKGSGLGGVILSTYGFLMLTPPTVWKRSHDHHHRNNSKLFGASIGSFPIMTTEKYQTATSSEQLEYRIARSPFVILFGYLTVFMFGMCLGPFLIDRKRHWDAPISFLIHVGLIATCAWFAGWQTAVFVLVIPAVIATTSGAYLFYAQHNFPSAKIRPRDQWTYTGAALQSSSFLEMGPIMNWLTGNIGYHHVHHLNSKIPFYRLPEAMAALVPLQSPNTTTLGVSDIIRCLRLKLWDAERNRFITFAEAKK